ncbi:MAG: helix-hairpin-helix domain-containing protein [Nocardioides sp.]
MASKNSASAHDEAVRRRLALLAAELAAVRPPTTSLPAQDSAELVSDAPQAWQADVGAAAQPEGRPWPEAPSADPRWLAAMEPLPIVPPASAAPPRLPGRHAERLHARQPLGSPQPGSSGRWDGFGGRMASVGSRAFAFSPLHTAVIALVVAAGLAVGAWWMFRAAPEEATLVGELGPSLATGDPSDSAAAPSIGATLAASDAGLVTGVGGRPASWSGADASTVVVDVAGKVRRPGIAVLPKGARVVDALEAAGGARRGVDLTSLNLARVLVDGEQILVGMSGAPGVAAESAVSEVPGSGALVNLNTADQAALEELPGVGPVTAAAIISWREAHQGFGAVEELVEVDGVGEATLARLAPLVTL